MANDVPKEIPDEVQRWTAKWRVALVLTILTGETTVAEAASEHRPSAKCRVAQARRRGAWLRWMGRVEYEQALR